MTHKPMSVSIIGGHNPNSYRVTTSDGAVIPSIRSIDFHVDVDSIPTATLGIVSAGMSLWEINASVPYDQLKLLAHAHGYKLVPIEEYGA
jgi:hypothetical protein